MQNISPKWELKVKFSSKISIWDQSQDFCVFFIAISSALLINFLNIFSSIFSQLFFFAASVFLFRTDVRWPSPLHFWVSSGPSDVIKLLQMSRWSRSDSVNLSGFKGICSVTLTLVWCLASGFSRWPPHHLPGCSKPLPLSCPPAPHSSPHPLHLFPVKKLPQPN